MKRRALAAILWFLAGWYVGALIAMFTGTSAYLGPILGTVAAGLIAGDPFGWIWVRPPKAAEHAAANVTAPSASTGVATAEPAQGTP